MTRTPAIELQSTLLGCSLSTFLEGGGSSFRLITVLLMGVLSPVLVCCVNDVIAMVILQHKTYQHSQQQQFCSTFLNRFKSQTLQTHFSTKF